MALMTENQPEPSRDASINEDLSEAKEGEIEEDSLDYFSSIADKSVKQGLTINSKLAEEVEILKSGLNTTANKDFKDTYICPENCKRMEVVTVNPEILNTASGHTKKQDHTSRMLQTELVRGLMASCSAYNQLYNLTLQDSLSKKRHLSRSQAIIRFHVPPSKCFTLY